MRIANMPFHALSTQEKETFKERCELMSTMGDLLRQTARQREQDHLEREQQRTSFSSSSFILLIESLYPNEYQYDYLS